MKDEKREFCSTGYHNHNCGNKLIILLINDWYCCRTKIGNCVVVSSYIYANKKDGYKTAAIFMLAKDGDFLTDHDRYRGQNH